MTTRAPYRWLMTLCLVTVVASCELFTIAQERSIARKLRSLPGVSGVHVRADDRGWPDSYFATLDTLAGPRLTFVSSNVAEPFSETPLRLSRVDDLAICVTGYECTGSQFDAAGIPVRSIFFARHVDIGGGGSFSNLFPKPIESLAVAASYAAMIGNVVASWPRCPDHAFHRDGRGNEMLYCTTRSPNSSSWPKPLEDWKPGVHCETP